MYPTVCTTAVVAQLVSPARSPRSLKFKDIQPARHN